MKKVGVLALQGGFAEHLDALRRLGVAASPVRLSTDLKGIDALVIPGGESTTIVKLMRENHLINEMSRLIADGLPVLGTCAGMVLLARKVSGLDKQPLGTMDIEIKRNAFGRQVDSFEADLDVSVLGQTPFHAIFIRAPLIEKVGGDVEILSNLPDGPPVAAREKNIVATAFHPELTTDPRFHEYFLTLVDGKLETEKA